MYIGAVVLDCANPQELAHFYAKLLGWQTHRADEEWIYVKREKEGGGPAIVFQKVEDYVRPVWPPKQGLQQQMAHMDFYTDDVVGDVKHALACGACLCETQCDDGWRVLLDPAGHPFCILPTKPPSKGEQAAIAALCQTR